MTRIANPRESGVDTVTAPIEAETTVEAIAAGVKAAPAGGELAAALVHLTAQLFAPGELQLSGQVLPADAGGPGLALTLATARGRVRERVTIRASELEPSAAFEGYAEKEADRLTRLATAGAVWTHFQVLDGELHLGKKDLRLTLRTDSWRSYALMRVGIETDVRSDCNATRVLYAKAVDIDPANWTAQFNLASAELNDKEFKQARLAAIRRLDHVHSVLEPSRQNGAHVGEVEKEPTAKSLLERDPLCYQLCYKRTAANLNFDVDYEARAEGSPQLRRTIEEACSALPSAGKGAYRAGARIQPVKGLELTPHDLDIVGQHVWDLTRTLDILHEADRKKWRMANSKPWKLRTDVLDAIEGPMLTLWAMVALRVGDDSGCLWKLEDLLASTGKQHAHRDGKHRKKLAKLVEKLKLTPGLAIAFAREGDEVLRRSRTRFGLACWYSDIGQLEDAFGELELSVEGGGSRAVHRLSDPQLRHLKNSATYKKKLSSLRKRYEPIPRPTPTPTPIPTPQPISDGNDGHHRRRMKIVFD
jgi:hypothetical protein